MDCERTHLAERLRIPITMIYVLHLLCVDYPFFSSSELVDLSQFDIFQWAVLVMETLTNCGKDIMLVLVLVQ